MNTNGLRLAKDEDFCRALADLGAYVVLSFDTFRPETAVKIHGGNVIDRKLRALENLERFGIGTTLLVRNDDLLRFLADRRVIVSLQFDGISDDVYLKLRGKPLLAEKLRLIDACANLNAPMSLTATIAKGINDHQVAPEWIGASAAKCAALATRDMSGAEQGLAVSAGFVMKPVYMLLSFLWIVWLWRRHEPDLTSLRRGLIAFWLGENASTVNYLCYGGRSDL